LEKTVVETKSLHNDIIYVCKKGSHKGFIKLLPRDEVRSCIWKRIDNNTFVLSSTSTTHKDREITDLARNSSIRIRMSSHENRDITKKRVRVSMPTVMKVQQQSDGRCKFTYCHSLGAGVLLSNAILDHYIERNLQITETVQQYFQRLRPLDLLDDKDGHAIGVNFNIQRAIERKKSGWYGGKHVERCVDVVVKENKCLQELTVIHPWFPSLMKGMLNNHIQVVAAAVNARMLNLSHKEAYTIGSKLSKVLRAKLTTEIAVDQWTKQHVALQEMDKKYSFFIPMCIVIGQQKVKDAPWVS